MSEIVHRLYAVESIRELERRAISGGTTGYELMRRAAVACWDEIARRWPMARNIHIVCGDGNNGGDGYEIAQLALSAQCSVTVWQLGDAPRSGEALLAYQAWRKSCKKNMPLKDMDLSQAELVVDALLGTGVSRPLEGECLRAVNAINEARRAGAKVLAVDVPSGLDGVAGAVNGAAVIADATVTFIGNKPGLFTGEGKDHVGEVVFNGLDIPLATYEGVPFTVQLLQKEDLPLQLIARRPDAHKGLHGHVLLVGGNLGMAGAILMAARAALRAGAGLVTVATREEHAVSLTAAQPELMCHAIEQPTDLNRLIEQADVIAIGPGLGQDHWARNLLARVQQSKSPQVWDADALNLLATEPTHSHHWVLTPHPREAARLLGVSTLQVQNNRAEAVMQIQQRYGGVAVLKGAGTWITGEQRRLCPFGNPGMAVGGMGDVLTGVIAAFIAQGLSLEEAAAMGVLAHALAGDVAAQTGQRGLLPTDLIENLRAVINW